MRKFMLGCLGCVAVASFVIAPSALAESIDGCALQGSANFSPGLGSSSQTFSYTLAGTLSGCQSSQSGAPEKGTIEAGQTLSERVTNSITGATDTVTYREWPVPSGEGTCANSTTTGRALVTWSDGTHTVELYSTHGGLATALTGEVAPSITLRAVNAQEGDPTTYTINTSRFAHLAPIDGALIFQPSEPAACSGSSGVTSASITGAMTVGEATPESVVGCALQGSANFSPGLSLTAQTFSYSLSGTLSGCQSNPSGAPEKGTIEAGQTLSERVTNSITGATDTVSYREWPVPSGEGTCANSTTTGRALVTWADGTHTVELYSTHGGLASALTGEVAPSMTLRAVNAQEGDPTTYTIKTTRLTHLTPVDGLLIFQPAEPAACSGSSGVTSASISGTLTSGLPNGNP